MQSLSFEICLYDPASPMSRDHDHELTQLVQHKSGFWVRDLKRIYANELNYPPPLKKKSLENHRLSDDFKEDRS